MRGTTVLPECSSSSPDSPNWDAVFLCLIESCAMYLRKDDLVKQATLAARAGELEKAVEHLHASQEDIDKVAKALGCTFVQLCDFAQQSPEEAIICQSGAFCGAFISDDVEKPFIGVAFKGSDGRDVITDIKWHPVQALQRPEIVWGAPTHRGFYFGLFGCFSEQQPGQIPFDVLQGQLSAIYENNARLHFTGHSLGGAYCTLAYGEFLRLQDDATFSQYNLGDLYSLAAPRTCLPPFSDEVNKRTQAGGGKYIFRIVNKEDPVPLIPPPPISWEIALNPFIHVGGAWRITDEGPEKMADEPPMVEPPQCEEMVFEDHDTRGYYASWQKTPHS
ncbi:alpha/beta-hydrolase [Trametes cingulata]|nr:alpha/beta-hydrolase [Trametes cingulata]